MKKTNKIIITVIVISVLLLGIGYAAIQNITLNITGTATADPSQANFKVIFSGTPEVSDSSKIKATVTDDINATINVDGVSAKGESVTATYIVQNVSTDLSANLSVETTNSNEEYFTIESKLAKTSLIAGDETTLTVTVELIKTPISMSEKSTIGIQLTAEPVQQGEDNEIIGDSTGESTQVTETSVGTYLPTGFTEVAGTSLETGLTIEDVLGNQYVWIDVPQTTEVYPTAGLGISEFTDEEYNRIEADLHTYTTTYRNATTFTYTDTWSSEETTGLTESEYYALKDKMLKSVYENGGFYIGKYEAGILSSYRDYELDVDTEHPITETIVVQADAYPYNWVRCSQAQKLASNIFVGNYTSSLMFGVQWDLVLKHIEVKAIESGMELETIQDILTRNSTNYGNYRDSEYSVTNTSVKYSTIDTQTNLCSEYLSAPYSKLSGECVILTTGASDTFCLFGLYDLAGNMAEWTLSGDESCTRPCLRGGSSTNYGDGVSFCLPLEYRKNGYTTGFRNSIF